MDGEGWDSFVFRCGWDFALKKMWVLLELLVFRVKGTQHVSSVAVGGVLKRAKVRPWIWLLSAVSMCSSGNYQTVTVTRFSKLKNIKKLFSVFIIYYSIELQKQKLKKNPNISFCNGIYQFWVIVDENRVMGYKNLQIPTNL